MNEKKIFQQRILSEVIIGCGILILIMSFIFNKMNAATFFGFAFLIIGILTFRKARKDEAELKNRK